MKKLFFSVLMVASATFSLSAQWQVQGDKIKSSWAAQVDPANVLPEYPRPQLVRAAWQNLNGLWDYAITARDLAAPAAFDGKILVPFCAESALSGVMREVKANQELWYQRNFTVPSAWKGQNVLLHFGAVDWKAQVYVNDIFVGEHRGGYVPFSFDITACLNGAKEQKLSVRVYDACNEGYQPRGKQTFKPEGIWYTAVTGIWQTVWMEPVPATHIAKVFPVADIDRKTLTVDVQAVGLQGGEIAQVELLDKGQVVATAKALAGSPLVLSVKEPKLWSPDSPFLYDLKVKVLRAGKVLDEAASYAAMRKISVKKGADGIQRMALNNDILFQFGPLDQGWWPDGLYTAPTDEALLYDIKKTKDFGFNMIRKHVKVEPARWYYHCDREGILVWQDMPSGDMGNQWDARSFNGGTDKKRSAESVANYYHEWTEIMDFCKFFPSVVVWVPFNEAWGQFDTEKVTAYTQEHEPTRLVNPASGGNHRMCGHILDLHHYPGPNMFLFDPLRVNVLGEYGGIGLPLEGHLWWNKRNWGYVQYKNSEDTTNEYVKFANNLKDYVKKGFAAAVYTQTTDVEGEVNGLMTYDRAVIKLDEGRVAKVNKEVINLIKK